MLVPLVAWASVAMVPSFNRNVEHCWGAHSNLCGFHVTESALMNSRQ